MSRIILRPRRYVGSEDGEDLPDVKTSLNAPVIEQLSDVQPAANFASGNNESVGG
jgi:hypothetical protein